MTDAALEALLNAINEEMDHAARRATGEANHSIAAALADVALTEIRTLGVIRRLALRMSAAANAVKTDPSK